MRSFQKKAKDDKKSLISQEFERRGVKPFSMKSSGFESYLAKNLANKIRKIRKNRHLKVSINNNRLTARDLKESFYGKFV